MREIIVAGVTDGGLDVIDTGKAADEVVETFDSLLHWYDPETGLTLRDLDGVYVDLIIHHQLGCPRRGDRTTGAWAPASHSEQFVEVH